MKFFLSLLISSFLSLFVIAETEGFVVDVDNDKLREMYGYRVFSDLQIGETISIYDVNLCWLNEKGLVGMVGDTHLYISGYENLVKVKRVSETAIAIDDFPVVGVGHYDRVATRNIFYSFNPGRCQGVENSRYGEVEYLTVQSINGTTSLSELLATVNK